MGAQRAVRRGARRAVPARVAPLDPPSPLELLAAVGVCVLVMSGGYMLLAARNAALLADGHAFWEPRLGVDALIPFMPAWTWIYCTYFLALLSLVVVARADRAVMYEVLIAYCGTSLISFACFALWPSRIPLPALDGCPGLGCSTLAFLNRMDGGFNLFPSLHVAQGLVVWLVVRRHLPALAWPAGVLVIGIAVSTVLTKRHFVIDIPAGLACGLLVYLAARRWGGALARLTRRGR